MNKQMNQVGSVLLSVVISLILLASLAGVVFLLKNRVDQVRKDKAIDVIEVVDKEKNIDDASGKEVVVKEETSSSEVPTVSELPATGVDFKLPMYLVVGIITSMFVYCFESKKYSKTRF